MSKKGNLYRKILKFIKFRCYFKVRELQSYYDGLLTILGKNESIQPDLQCLNLLTMIPAEIQAIKDTSLGDFDLNHEYNVTKAEYEKVIKDLEAKFESDQQNLMDEHEKEMKIVELKLQNASAIMEEILIEQEALITNFTLWKNASETCSFSGTGLTIDDIESPAAEDPSFCSIPVSWFFEYKEIIASKIVMQKNLRKTSNCKTKINWLKETARALKKAFRVISAHNQILKATNSYEERIGELKKIHEDFLNQVERENKQTRANARKELHKINVRLRTLRTEIERTKKTNRIKLNGFTAKLISCPLPRAVSIMMDFYDDGQFMEEVVVRALDFDGFYNPKPVLKLLKSSHISSKFSLQVRGYSALYNSLKLNLHHVAELTEVKAFLLQQTQKKLTTTEGNFIDSMNFDADILTRHSGSRDSGQRCHHVYNCNLYEQFLMSPITSMDLPLVDISSASDSQVNWFDISDNKNVKYLPRNVFRKFPNTEIYTAFDSGLVEINRNNFYGAEKLHGLWLDHNKIASIESESFSEMSSLEWLYLGFNQLTTIDANLFDNLVALNSLSLEKNKLTSLSPHAFYSLGKLEWIHLNRNPVSSSINDEYFTNNTKLTNKYILNSQI